MAIQILKKENPITYSQKEFARNVFIPLRYLPNSDEKLHD
jgi:hypothetical protein